MVLPSVRSLRSTNTQLSSGTPLSLSPLMPSLPLSVGRPPVEICAEFEVERVQLSANQSGALSSLPCASIFIIVAGSCTISPSSASPPSSAREEGATVARAGSIFLLSANSSALIRTSEGGERVEGEGGGVTIYRAHVNLAHTFSP
jgi:hypothetical protein